MKKGQVILISVVVLAVIAYVAYAMRKANQTQQIASNNSTANDYINDKRTFFERARDELGLRTWQDTINDLPMEF